MDWRAAFKGSYIAAIEFNGKEPTLTISEIKIVKVDDEKTKREKDKLVVFFREVDRGWIPCKTGAICLAALFGTNETDHWLGRRVTLHSQRVRFGAEIVDGIRVKGSPDIAAPVDVVVKLPKKKPQTVTLVPTGKKNGAAAPPAPSHDALPDSEGVLPDAPEPGADG